MGNKRKERGGGSGRHLKLRLGLGASSLVRSLLARPCTDSEALGEKKALSVFLNGVPFETTQLELGDAMSVFGAVEGCLVHDESGATKTKRKSSSFKSAVVIFKKKKGVESVLGTSSSKLQVPTLTASDKVDQGAYRLLKEYRKARPGNKVLLDRVNQWIEEKEEEEERQREEREAAAASDGWTVVTSRKGRHKNRDSQGINVSAVAKAAAESKRKEAALHTDFYHFQQREARRNEILDLQQKFKEDKKRIAELRAKRKFNPYIM